MSKDPASDAVVYVRNEDLVNGGYIFEEVDNWSGLPGNSILKNFRFAGTPAEQWGDGSITVDGDGTVSDASVIYLYRMDVTEPSIICTNPLTSPECPGFLDALYKYLEGLEYLDPEDDFYDYWLEIQEEREIEPEEEIIVAEEDEDDLEKSLKTDPDVGGFIDGFIQQGLLERLSNDPLIQPYYEVDYPEVLVYEDTLQLEDTVLPDNNRAMRQLANDAKHYSMVRSQYDRENTTGE
jgi:hypothetical protein